MLVRPLRATAAATVLAQDETHLRRNATCSRFSKSRKSTIFKHVPNERAKAGQALLQGERMRIFVYVLMSFCALAVPALGQTVTTYDDCSALDGVIVDPGPSSPGPNPSQTITNSIIVENLDDADLIDIEIQVTGVSGILAQINVQIDVETDTIFSGSFLVGETGSAQYDPDGNQSSTSIVFNSEFVPDPVSGSVEIFVKYFIDCTPNSGTTATTTTTNRSRRHGIPGRAHAQAS